MKVIKLAAVAALATTLASCSVLPESEKVALYQLPETHLEKSETEIHQTLKVMTVESSDALNNRRILVSSDGASLTALPGARWMSPARTLVRDRLLEGFAADGRIARLTTDDASLRSDLELHGVLRNFEGTFRTKEQAAYIRFDASLADAGSRQVLAFKQFRVEAASSDRTPAAMVQAFSLASDQLSREILNWISDTLSNQEPD